MQVKKEDREAIYIDFEDKVVVGKCKAKDLSRQIKSIKSVFNE